MSVLEKLRQKALEIDVDRFEDTLLAEAAAKPTAEVAKKFPSSMTGMWPHLKMSSPW